MRNRIGISRALDLVTLTLATGPGAYGLAIELNSVPTTEVDASQYQSQRAFPMFIRATAIKGYWYFKRTSPA
jgi:hypothetical protein